MAVLIIIMISEIFRDCESRNVNSNISKLSLCSTSSEVNCRSVWSVDPNSASKIKAVNTSSMLTTLTY
jgi:hypothetical protein